jgi:hypothetical protein
MSAPYGSACTTDWHCVVTVGTGFVQWDPQNRQAVYDLLFIIACAQDHRYDRAARVYLEGGGNHRTFRKSAGTLGNSTCQLIPNDAKGHVDLASHVIHAGDCRECDQRNHQCVFDQILTGVFPVEASEASGKL